MLDYIEPSHDEANPIQGRRRTCWKGGSSSSSTSSTNIDKRIAIEEGVGISADNSTANVTVQAVDAAIVNKALDTVTAADATAGAGFEKLLGLAGNLFEGAGKIAEATQKTTMAQVGALSSAQNDARGQIDQRTIIVIAALGAGVAAASMFRKG